MGIKAALGIGTAGAGVGAVGGPAGALVGGIGGFVLGLFLGNEEQAPSSAAPIWTHGDPTLPGGGGGAGGGGGYTPPSSPTYYQPTNGYMPTPTTGSPVGGTEAAPTSPSPVTQAPPIETQAIPDPIPMGGRTPAAQPAQTLPVTGPDPLPQAVPPVETVIPSDSVAPVGQSSGSSTAGAEPSALQRLAAQAAQSMMKIDTSSVSTPSSGSSAPPVDAPVSGSSALEQLRAQSGVGLAPVETAQQAAQSIVTQGDRIAVPPQPTFQTAKLAPTMNTGARQAIERLAQPATSSSIRFKK